MHGVSTYMCINTISELKSLAGMIPESWFLLKWLQDRRIKLYIVIYPKNIVLCKDSIKNSKRCSTFILNNIFARTRVNYLGFGVEKGNTYKCLALRRRSKPGVVEVDIGRCPVN